MNTYLLNNLYPNCNPYDSTLLYQLMIGNDKDFLPTRVSYKLNLTGPSVNIQTGCSTSLVAVHLACQSLINGECEMVLAGGVGISVPQKAGYFYQEGLVLSPNGHCRAFDANAKGTVGGNGVGIVVLKRLTDAIADGDNIMAVIKGSAINNDGALKVGYTAPSVKGQAAVIKEAQGIAGIDPKTCTYIETHGSGTVMGDPIEIAALKEAFALKEIGFCAIGSLKTNIGHLGVAAGVASLIKTVLALKHRLIPPSLNFETPNPEIDFANSPFYVNTKLREWKTNGTPRRAGVSSFGVGGTNAHVVLEEWAHKLAIANTANTANTAKKDAVSPQLLLLSAKTLTALETATQNLAIHLTQHPNINLADVAYTLSLGRRTFNYRRMLVCASTEEAVRTLGNRGNVDPSGILSSDSETKTKSVVFLFPGQGCQYVNMGKEIYQNWPTFRHQVDRCCLLLAPYLNLDLRDILYPTEIEAAKEQIKQPAIAQSILFIIEYALALLWIEWGVSPVAFIGYSIGEYVAATLAGVISLEAALALIVEQGKMLENLSGAMLALPLAYQEVASLLTDQLSLAAINSPTNCVVSGSTEAIETLEQQLALQGVFGVRLPGAQPLHSHLMESVAASFAEKVKQIDLNPPQIPYISNVTGNWITAAQATDPYYWAQHLCQTVDFAAGIAKVLSPTEQILLELGPAGSLNTLIKQHPDRDPQQMLLTSMRHSPEPHFPEQHSDTVFILNTLGRLWLAGLPINWANFYAGQPRYRIPLPTYPYERQRYWVEPLAPSPIAAQSGIDKPSEPLLPLRRSEQKSETAYLVARRHCEAEMIDIWSQILGVKQIGINDDFFKLGGDSLVAVRVIAQINDTFQVDWPSSILLQHPTIAALSQLIRTSNNLIIKSVLAPIQLYGDQAPLFCVHPVGGNIFCYTALCQQLGQTHPIYGLQSLGLTQPQIALPTIEAMASHYLEAIKEVQPQGPYHLIGWSMGGVISYEMARQLVQHGETIALLGLIDSYLPIAKDHPNESQLLMWLIRDLAGQAGQKLPPALESVAEKSVSVAQVWELTQQYQVLPPDLSLKALEHLWQIFQTNILALLQYHPQPYNGPALSLLASESMAQAADTLNYEWDTLKWNTLIKGELSVQIIEGNHFTLMREPDQVAAVASYLQSVLRRAQLRSS
jgi:acyl transferase domain-containing protein/thioesterase domain-containing protein/acyl carrier protein